MKLRSRTKAIADDTGEGDIVLSAHDITVAFADKVILDSGTGAGGSGGVVPYLPLNELSRPAQTRGTGAKP